MDSNEQLVSGMKGDDSDGGNMLEGGERNAGGWEIEKVGRMRGMEGGADNLLHGIGPQP